MLQLWKVSHLDKNYWYKKDKGAKNGKDDKGENLAREDSNDSDIMVFMVAV